MRGSVVAALLCVSALPSCKRAAAPQTAGPSETESAVEKPGHLISPPAQASSLAALPPKIPVGIALEGVQTAVREFRSAMGENPVGTNAEITRAILGDNLKQVKIPIPAGSAVSDQGELCDPWGMPYFFHQLSHNEMEIHSAGPDRVMFTDDDQEMK